MNETIALYGPILMCRLDRNTGLGFHEALLSGTCLVRGLGFHEALARHPGRTKREQRGLGPISFLASDIYEMHKSIYFTLLLTGK